MIEIMIPMLIQYKLQPHPNDGSPLKRRSRHRKIARNFAKEKDNCGGKASFAHFWHPDMRNGQEVFPGVLSKVSF